MNPPTPVSRATERRSLVKRLDDPDRVFSEVARVLEPDRS